MVGEKEHGLQGFILGSKMFLRVVMIAYGTKCKRLLNLWKLAYYKNDKRCQSGLESDNDSLILMKEED